MKILVLPRRRAGVPLEAFQTSDPGDVEARVDTYESISLAFLVLLEELQPIERAVFLLREVFEYEYAEIATFLDKSEVACRQWFSRAKKHLADRRPRFPPSPETHRQLLTGFLQAVQVGDMTGLMNMLAEGVTLWADGGGKVSGAATQPIAGRADALRFLLGTRRVAPETYQFELVEVNRQPALIVRADGRVYLVLTIEVEAQRIQTIRVVANPEKLAHLRAGRAGQSTEVDELRWKSRLGQRLWYGSGRLAARRTRAVS